MENEPRQRILLLLKFLLEQTDEAHYVSVADILRFWEAHGIHGNRKNVYSDIQLLMDSGVDVICIRNMQNRYFIGSRLLELPELKLLVDAVESSHLITEKKSAALIEKLGHLTSRHNAALLNRPVYMDGIIGASKTGSTLEGGKCLIAEAHQGDRTLVCVVLGAPMSGDSKGITSNFHDTKALVEWGFGAWQTGEVVSPGDPLLSVDVEFSSDGDEVGIEATSAIVATVPADLTLDDLTITPTWSETLRAPLTEGSTVGEVTVALDDQQLGTVSVAPARSVGLSIPDFVIWWITSDISHALIVATVVVALFAVIGIICGVSAKKRRLREQRLRVSSGRSYGVSPDVAGARRSNYGPGAPASGKRAAAPKGSGRHMRQ